MPTSPHRAPAAPAHLAWRLFALAYDLLPLLALWFAATMLALRAEVAATGPNGPSIFPATSAGS